METKEFLKNMIIRRIDRFLGEMPPYWDKIGFAKDIFPHEIESDIIQKILQELQNEKIIYLTGDDKYFFVITEDYIYRTPFSSQNFTNIRIKQIQEIMSNFAK